MPEPKYTRTIWRKSRYHIDSRLFDGFWYICIEGNYPDTEKGFPERRKEIVWRSKPFVKCQDATEATIKEYYRRGCRYRRVAMSLGARNCNNEKTRND